MTTTYLDTSAAMKLIVDEEESEALLLELSRTPRDLISSWILHTELHCAAGRRPEDLDLESIATVLDTVYLTDVTRGDLISAGTLTPLRANDAIHLATAIRSGVDEIVVYDLELARAASAAGIHVLSPR